MAVSFQTKLNLKYKTFLGTIVNFVKYLCRSIGFCVNDLSIINQQEKTPFKDLIPNDKTYVFPVI